MYSVAIIFFIVNIFKMHMIQRKSGPLSFDIFSYITNKKVF